METNSPSLCSSCSSSSSCTPSFKYIPHVSAPYRPLQLDKSPDDNGYLSLDGNPGPWIQNNSPSSHLLVKNLSLNFHFMNENQQEIAESIDRLTFLTHLSISNPKSLKRLPISMANLQNLHFLTINSCSQGLPLNLGVLKNSLTHITLCYDKTLKLLPQSMGDLHKLRNAEFRDCETLPKNIGVLKMSLTHLTLYRCKFKYLSESVATLFNLASLHFSSCACLAELPASLVQLKRLRDVYVADCPRLRSIPNLLHLETLRIQRFDPRNEFCYTCFDPKQCRIHLIPGSLINLRRLEVSLDICSEGSIAILKDLVNLQILIMAFGSPYVQSVIPELKANLYRLAKLQILCFRAPFDEFPDNLEGLDELVLLDVQGTAVKYLPWSIMKLPKLKFLMLPRRFRFQTLPFHLNDSVLISVEGWHIRKTWKQLKHEIGVAEFPIAQSEYPSSIVPPGYLSFQGDIGQWIRANDESRFLAKMLDLELPEDFSVHFTKNSIGEFPNLTHLFITSPRKTACLPYTITGLKHLCLEWCDSKCHAVSLGRLPNLETLDLIVNTLPRNPDLPVSLRRLYLASSSTCSLPANMANLSNLQTLEISGFSRLTSLAPLNIVNLKINRIINSLPIGLRCLEIVHDKRRCTVKYDDKYCEINLLEQSLTQLVNLEAFSLTCYHIKCLPRMAGQHNLRVLLLKDCFALKELLPDVEQLSELQTLDISGTRVKSLPDSIINLSKLQQLTLPKCFTQKLSRKLEQVSVVDDTDNRYYEHMGYFDSKFEMISYSSDEGNDAAVGSVEEVDEAVVEYPKQGVSNGKACEQNDVTAQVPIVSRSTMKRGENEHGIIWPSSKKTKQFHDAMEEKDKPNIDSPCLDKTVDEPSGHGHERNVLKSAAATMATVENIPLEYVKESNMEVPQHVQVHLVGENQANIVQPNGISSSFNYVKACYEGDPVWIDFSMTSSFDQLNESVCKKFGIEVNTFKIKFLDEDQEWMLMTCVSDLTHALVHTSSSGKKFVRLSVIDKGVVHTAQGRSQTEATS